MEEKMKICSKCRKFKLLNKYYNKKGTNDGLQSHCKKCDKRKVNKLEFGTDELIKKELNSDVSIINRN